MNNELSPQHVLFQTIKSLVLKLNNLIRELADQQNELKKRLENRSRRVNEYVTSNEAWRKTAEEKFSEINKKIDSLSEEIVKINDHFKEKEIRRSVMNKLFENLKKVPGYIVAIISAIIALVSYFIEHLNFIP